MQITFIGTLPPLKTNVYYCTSLVKSLSKLAKVEFVSFKSLYPGFIYPGRTQIDDTFKFQFNENVKIRQILSYYNPLSWLFVGLAAKGSIIHAQWWNLWLTPIFAVIFLIAKLRNKKTALTVHNVLPHTTSQLRVYVNKFFNKILFALSDALIVHSNINATQLSAFFGIPKEKIFVAHMGIHDAYLQKGLPKSEAKKLLGLRDDTKTALYFGTIKNYKGVDDLITAFAQVYKKHKNSKLLIVGEPWINWEECELLIKKYGLSEAVIKQLEYVPMVEVEKFYAAADLVVLPYKFFDAQSGPGNIALAFGKPMVVTNVGSLPALVKNKIAVVEPNNTEQLSGAMLQILPNEELLCQLSEDSKELAKKYSWDSIAESTVAIYKTL